MNAVLNAKISQAATRSCLERMRMRVKAGGKGSLRVTVPSYRVDMKREIDLVEEVARLRGYDKIRDIAPRGVVYAEMKGEPELMRERVREILCAMGFYESICLSFMGAAEMDKLMWPHNHPLRRAVVLKNPVSEEFSCLRTSMLPPLMRCASLNVKRGNDVVKLFELGKVFLARADEPPVEEEKLALAVTGRMGARNWCSSPPETGFFYLKGVLSALVEGTPATISAKSDSLASCHPGRAATLLLSGKKWGWMGEINPRVADSYGIGTPLVFAEVNTEPLFSALAGEFSYEPLPRFPYVTRDVAVVADEGLEADGIVGAARDAAPEFIESVDVFDLYREKPIPEGKKGLAMSIRLRSDRGTLSEKDIKQAMKKINAALKNIGCQIREK